MFDDSTIDTGTRRTFLKATAATLGSTIVPATVAGGSTPDAVRFEGTKHDPIQRPHIDDARATVLDGDPTSSANADRVAVADDPVPEDGYLAGYAIGMNGTAPVETIHCVTDPKPVEECATGPDWLPYTIRPFGSDHVDTRDAPSHPTRSEIRTRDQQRAHQSIDRFQTDIATSIPGSVWSRIGTTTVERPATIGVPDGGAARVGRIELTVETFERSEDNQDGENYIACALEASITPGCQMPSAEPFVNETTVLTQRWAENETGGHEITDWGPTTDRTGAIDWSKPDADLLNTPDAALTSYSVDHIARTVASTPNETVAHRYTYPTAFLSGTTAKDQSVTLANYAEGWIDDADPRERFLAVDLRQVFDGTHAVLGPIERNVSTELRETIGLAAYTL